jgi:hypothetical protein
MVLKILDIPSIAYYCFPYTRTFLPMKIPQLLLSKHIIETPPVSGSRTGYCMNLPRDSGKIHRPTRRLSCSNRGTHPYVLEKADH